MRRLVVACLFISACQSGATTLAGRTVPPYPDGLSSRMGKCIAEGADLCAFTISTLHDAADRVVAVIGAVAVGEGAQRRILDALPAPELAPGQLWAIEECRVDGQPDPAAIGIVTYRNMGGWIETTDTVWAVRFDTVTRTLRPLDADSVQCVLPGS